MRPKTLVYLTREAGTTLIAPYPVATYNLHTSHGSTAITRFLGRKLTRWALRSVPNRGRRFLRRSSRAGQSALLSRFTLILMSSLIWHSGHTFCSCCTRSTVVALRPAAVSQRGLPQFSLGVHARRSWPAVISLFTDGPKARFFSTSSLLCWLRPFAGACAEALLTAAMATGILMIEAIGLTTVRWLAS